MDERYNLKLSRDNQELIYVGTRCRFEEIKNNYTGLLAKIHRTMSSSDQASLAECVNRLLPLTLQEDGAFVEEAAELTMQILSYASKFRNTGVKKA